VQQTEMGVDRHLLYSIGFLLWFGKEKTLFEKGFEE